SNDCDEEIDEDLDPMSLACPLGMGVCAGVARACDAGMLTPATCDAGCPGDSCLYGPDFVAEEGGVAGVGCGDSLDNDCDGELNEGCPQCTEGEPCQPNNRCVGNVSADFCPCGPGVQRCNPDGTLDTCIDPRDDMPVQFPFTGEPEICDNMIDENC